MNAAIEFNTASAGSGKTYRLVEIVSAAIEAGLVRPQGIVATTFTVAAANELRERLAGKFHEADRHQDAVLLGSGMIGTVHGICLELLTRFALQAGLSPEVTILDDTQSQILLSRAFDTILTEDEENALYQLSSRLSQTDPQTSSHFYRTVIPDIVSKARSNDIDPAALPAMGTASWVEMKSALPASTTEDLDQNLATAINGALRELDPKSTVGVIKEYRLLLEQSARSLASGKLTWAEWNKLATASPGSGKANAHIAPPVQEAASRLGEHPQFHRDLEAYLALLFQAAQRLAEKFGNLKRESGAADFADLEKEALDLLTHSDEVRSILTDEIDLLVVDEFQDTSPIQLALFSRLAECAKRVVWVGDVKQAIYGFRGADPELIIAAVAGAEKAGTLGQSWRSAPDLVHFVNELFAKPFCDHLQLPAAEVTLIPQRQAHPAAAPAIRIAKVSTGEVSANGKGLEWPIVFATDLDTDTRSRLFSLRPHSEAAALDLANPLAGRSLRLWIDPFGKSNAALRDRLHASPTGQRAEAAALSEDLRLLYVGVTRARDILVLVHDPATTPSWFDLTQTQDLLAAETGELTVGEVTIPLAVTTQTYEPLATKPIPAATIQVPIQRHTRTPRPPLLITPSSREPIAGAAVAEIIEFGQVLDIPASINACDYGDAMHRIIAAEIQNPNHPARQDRAVQLLTHWGLEKSLSPEQVLATVDAYRQWIETKFKPTRQFVEVPFSHTTHDGQQATGFIDHLLLTPQGPVILDHKIFPGPKSMWEPTALSYSGQLDLYRQVVSAEFPDEPVAECWIHLASFGAAARVAGDP